LMDDELVREFLNANELRHTVG